tara:strand:- start:1249 stop:1542 length:294 start_codon:yes stop_codon:yes gene_type:complete
MGLFLMAFTEDLDTFFVDFSNNVEYKGVYYKGILEQPDELVADGIVMTTDYELTVKTSNLGNLDFETEIVIDQIKYKVRNVRKIDDGTLSKISLTKV